ncbi:MAG: YjzC family protein [Clostridiales bacterium]|nr:YjzC family protein [Clostridiales bacterium]
MSKQYKPGEQAPKSGNYSCYDENGNCGGSCYLEQGQRFPATQHSGSHYEEEMEQE